MKKLTAGIFTVLMGLVSVNAADAAVASKGYVDQQVKVNADAISAMDTAYKAADTGLDTRLQAVEALNGTGEGSVSAQIKAVEEAYKAADTVLDGKISGVDAAYKAADTALESSLKDYADDGLALKQNVSNIHTDANVVLSGDDLNTKYPSVGYVDTKIQGVSADFSNVNTVLGEISGDNGISVDIETGTDGSVTSIALTGSYDGELSAESENAVQNKVVKAALDLKANIADLDGAYVSEAEMTTFKGENTTAIANAKSEAISAAAADATSKANAAQAAAEKTASDALKAYSTTEQMNTAIATATEGMATQDYVVTKANAALNASVGYTDAVVDGLKLADIARVPAACSEKTKYCALTTDGTNFIWEVIERATGETIEGTPVVVPDEDTIEKPAAIVK